MLYAGRPYPPNFGGHGVTVVDGLVLEGSDNGLSAYDEALSSGCQPGTLTTGT